MVYDYLSFKAWYARYINKLVDQRKQLARRSRLMVMNKLRRSAKKPDDKGNRTERNSLLSKRGGGDKPKGDGPKGSAGSTTQNQPAPSELQRRGPAPSVTRNRHNNLFRPSADFLKNKRCYNCDELGHLAKDCLKPKRPRRQRSRWKDRVQSLVSSELYELRPTDEMSDDKSIVEHWKNTVEAFLSSVQWDDDSHSHADTPSHGETSTQWLPQETTLWRISPRWTIRLMARM